MHHALHLQVRTYTFAIYQDQNSNLNHEEKGVDDGLRNCEAGPSTKPECEDVSDKVGLEIVFILCFLHGLEVRIYLGLGVCCLYGVADVR